MLLALLTTLALQAEEVIDLRVLSNPMRGQVRVFTSLDPAAFARQVDGTLLLGERQGRHGRLARVWLLGGHERTHLRARLDRDSGDAFNERIGVAFEDGRPPFLSYFAFSPDRAAGARVAYTTVEYQRTAALTVSSRLEGYEVEFVEGEVSDANLFPLTPRNSTYELPPIEVAPKASKTLGAVPDGEGTILQLNLVPSGFEPADFRNVWLRVFVDGEERPGIEASLSQLFARGSAKTTFAGVALVNTEAELRLRLPIPFANGCRVEIENRGDRPVKLKGSADLNRDALVPGTRRLRVGSWSATAEAGAPLEVAQLAGDGHFVGLTARFARPKGTIRGGRLVVECDGSAAYRSVSLASAFDAGGEFSKAPHATVAAGVSEADDAAVTAYCFRVLRALPFAKKARVALLAPEEGSTAAEGAWFAYVRPDPPASSGPASRPSESRPR